MILTAKSIRAFIGSKDYSVSRKFYRELGLEEVVVSDDMSLFKIDHFGFYLQDYYVKDWIDNSMVFLEVADLKHHLERLKRLALPDRYEKVRLSQISYYDWGNEFFLHDPSGVLWHFGEFNSRTT